MIATRRLAMIADDLTGACDAGVQFAQRGMSTLVRLDPESQPDAAAELVVLTTDSRELASGEAQERVARACVRLAADGRALVYKKIDSTLRGNVVPEIEAALDACGVEQAFLAPAFPAMGRTVVQGWLCVNGERLARLPESPRALAFDTDCDDDLAALARRAFHMHPRPLPVGSGGLAREIAKLLAPAAASPPPIQSSRRGVVVCVVGSTHPATLAQVAYLEAKRPPGSYSLIAAGQAGTEVTFAARNASALLLTGGYTAGVFCRALGAQAIRLHREALDGIPYGTLMGGPLDGTPVITKAGGFGGEDAMARIVDLFGPGQSG